MFNTDDSAGVLLQVSTALYGCVKFALTLQLATASKKKGKLKDEGHWFQGRWKLQKCFTDNQNNCVCKICQETVALYKEHNAKRHDEAKHASRYDKLSETDHDGKVKQLQESLATQQQFFTWAHGPNENISKASY